MYPKEGQPVCSPRGRAQGTHFVKAHKQTRKVETCLALSFIIRHPCQSYRPIPQQTLTLTMPQFHSSVQGSDTGEPLCTITASWICKNELGSAIINAIICTVLFLLLHVKISSVFVAVSLLHDQLSPSLWTMHPQWLWPCFTVFCCNWHSMWDVQEHTLAWVSLVFSYFVFFLLLFSILRILRFGSVYDELVW